MMELRDRILGGSAHELGIVPVGDVWGVVMEMGFPTATVTLVALADGNASLYFSTGGGVIGGIGHEPVRLAARKLCELGDRLKDHAAAVEKFPVPARDHVLFYVLTISGVRAAGGRQVEIAASEHALAPLFFAGQDVITQLRLVSEAG